MEKTQKCLEEWGCRTGPRCGVAGSLVERRQANAQTQAMGIADMFAVGSQKTGSVKLWTIAFLLKRGFIDRLRSAAGPITY